MSRATITSKGQVTIPASVREALNLDAGDQLLIELNSQGFSAQVIKRARASDLRGLFGQEPLPDQQTLRDTLAGQLARGHAE